MRSASVIEFNERMDQMIFFFGMMFAKKKSVTQLEYFDIHRYTGENIFGSLEQITNLLWK